MDEAQKQRLANVARSTGLLPATDYGRFLIDLLRSHRDNRRFSSRHPDVPFPPSDLMFEAFNHTSLETYDRTGREHADLIASLVSEFVGTRPIRGCEWGCGPGRVVRHLRAALLNLVELTGVDFNHRSIEWCTRHIGGVVFERTQLRPPLPFADRSFDFVYALSVLTHLDEAAGTSWIQELARVTSDGGLIIFTTHGSAFLSKLLPPERSAFESGNVVVRGKTRQGKKLFATFHPESYVRRTLPEQLSVLRHIASGGPWNLMQDVWVLRNTVAEP